MTRLWRTIRIPLDIYEKASEISRRNHVPIYDALSQYLQGPYAKERYDEGTASSNSGWEFEGWNGSGEGSYSGMNDTASIVVNAPLVETATFYPGLTIATSNGISVSYIYGSISGSIPAGTSKTIFAPKGTNITITASPTFFVYSFSIWTGSTISSESTTYVILNSPQSLTASYSFSYINISILSAVVIAAAVMVLLFIRRKKET